MSSKAPSTIWTYKLNGVQTEFGIKFDYLSRKFVEVTLIGSGKRLQLTVMKDYRFINPRTIKTSRTYGPSDGYEFIEIRRVTSATDLIVDFTDGSILRANDLTTANLQAMHIAEEARGLAADGISVNDEGHLDARHRRIINLGDPVNRKDAVNKAYVDDAVDGVIANKNETKRYRDEALSFRNAAAGFDDSSEQQALLSKRYANDSLQSGKQANSVLQETKSVLSETKKQSEVANGYAKATIQNAQAAADNVEATIINAQLTQRNKEQCAGHEAATAVYEQGAREAEAAAQSSQRVSEEASKMAKQSEAKALDSKTKAEAARDEAIRNSKSSDTFARSAEDSAQAAAKSAQAASTSAGNALTQASNALRDAGKAEAARDRAEAAASKVDLKGTMVKPKWLSITDTFNDLTDGVYYAQNDGSVESSRPINKAGTLEVSSEGYLQRFYVWNSPQCWWRYCESRAGEAWQYSKWYRMDGMRPKYLRRTSDREWLDLNTFLEDGFYTCYDNPPSSWEGLHYPEKLAGMLQVMQAHGGDGTFQTYTTYLGSVYARWRQGSDWSPWKRQATKGEVDSKVAKSQLDVDGSLSTSTSEVPTMYTLARMARKGFTTKWTGNSSNVTIDGLTSTYGLEIKVMVGSYAYKYEFSYDNSYSKFIGWYSPPSKYIEVKQDARAFTVTSYGGIDITRVEIRENFVGEPL